jgi:hypothetical protein
MKLIKGAIMWDPEGDVYQTGEPIRYEVAGIPNGKAFIAKMDGVGTMNAPDAGPRGAWEGEHATAEAALAFLAEAGEKADV